MEDRYSIRLDENGQPYLAHALFNSGRQGQGTRQNHKYILKIGQGEQARYFYTPEEVRAYYNELKRKASGKVEDAKKSVQNTVKNTAQNAVNTVKDKAFDARWTAEQTGKNVVQKTKDAIGITAKQNAKEAQRNLDRANRMTEESRQKHGSDDALTKTFEELTEQRKRELERAENRYNQTALGKAEGTVKNVKSKAERMREEFRKKDQEKAAAEPVRSKGPAGMEKKPAEAEQKTEKKDWEDNRPVGRKRNVTGTAEKIEKGKRAAQVELDAIDTKIEPLQKKAENARNEYLRARDKYGDDSKEAQAYRDDYFKIEHEIMALEEQWRDRKDRDTWAHAQNSVDPKGQDTYNDLAFTKTKPSEYKANDSDFDEKNYSEKNHVKDTDFYTFKRSDGRWVILEEDMKWVLPEGVSGDNPKVRKALRSYADEESSKASMKKDSYTYDDWVNAVSEAIDEAAEGAREEEKKKSK